MVEIADRAVAVGSNAKAKLVKKPDSFAACHIAAVACEVIQSTRSFEIMRDFLVLFKDETEVGTAQHIPPPAGAVK